MVFVEMRIPRSQLLSFALVAAASAAVALARPAPGPLSDRRGDLGEQISAATGLSVHPGTIETTSRREWKPGFRPAVSPRELIFLASEDPGGPADLYLAEVRTAPGPRLVSIGETVNLTRSADGDDYLLAVRPPYAVVATRALGQVRSLTVFDLAGREPSRGEAWTPLQRLLSRLTDLQRCGRLLGIGRLNLRFLYPPRDVELGFTERDGRRILLAEWRDRTGETHLTGIDPESGGCADEGLEAIPDLRLPKRPILWAVDTVRAIPWIGPGPIQWAEGRFFALRDRLRRLRYEMRGGEERTAGEASGGNQGETARFEVQPGAEVGEESPRVEWPPPKIDPPVFSRRAAGEGIWRPTAPEFVRRLPGAPPSIVGTYVRTDSARPYVKVHLFALDMRQLEMHMVAGQEDPQSTTGAQGTGRIPRDPELLPRVVAAFNGAFKTEHGAYGMMVERDVLLPPADEAATVATYEDGQAAMGSWPAGYPIPERMVSFRQNMDPLVEGGVVNPRRRYLWGFTLGDDIKNMNTVRSGICMRGDGTLIYGWGEDLTATTLGKALNAAGCTYGMHLDMNPYHTAFVYYRFSRDVNVDNLRFDSQIAISDMRYWTKRYVYGAPKDFFFFALRDSSPGSGWSSEGLAQPAPAEVPAVFRKRVGEVEMLAVAADRFRAGISPGDVPEDLAPAAPDRAELDDSRLLAEIELGPYDADRGQLVAGSVVARLVEGRATLRQLRDGAIETAPWSRAPGEPAVYEAVQGGWLVRDGEAVSAGDSPVAAIGAIGDRFLVAGFGPSAALAEVLVAEGVESAIRWDAARRESWASLRRESGMTDFDGEPVRALPEKEATLRLLGEPVHLGAVRFPRREEVGGETSATAEPSD